MDLTVLAFSKSDLFNFKILNPVGEICGTSKCEDDDVINRVIG